MNFYFPFCLSSNKNKYKKKEINDLKNNVINWNFLMPIVEYEANQFHNSSHSSWQNNYYIKRACTRLSYWHKLISVLSFKKKIKSTFMGINCLSNK